MFGNLRRLLEGSLAQINPLDKGKTFGDVAQFKPFSKLNKSGARTPQRPQPEMATGSIKGARIRPQPKRLRYSLDQGIGNPRGDFEYFPLPVFDTRQELEAYGRPDWFPKSNSPPVQMPTLRPTS